MRTALLSLVLLPLLCTAQSWCPPGATWTYEAGIALAGFQRMSYRTDTVVDGHAAQVIDRYAAIQYPQPQAPAFGGPPIMQYAPVAAITRFADEVVHLWSGTEWDTLYWFGADVGQGWSAPFAWPDCEPFEVLETGTEVFNGVPLRWLDIGQGFRVYERIGSTFDFFLYCPNQIICGPTGMRCYRDDELAMLSAWVECEALVGMQEAATTPELLLFPNPGSEQLSLTLPPGSHRVALSDALGRVLATHASLSGTATVATAHLPPGTYVIRVGGSDGLRTSARWMKE